MDLLLPLIPNDKRGCKWYVQDVTTRFLLQAKSLFTTRQTLRRVFVLIDSRHGLLANDLEFLDFLDESQVKYQVLLTKTDLVKKTDLARRIYLLKRVRISHLPLLSCS